ncbi:MAG: serine/threonine-protein kinase [Solirubrobacteraceae bacterium]
MTEALIAEAAGILGVTVVRPLKQGGQKTVLLADEDGEHRVLKVISTGSLPDSLRRAQREVELLQRVQHPNVVRVASSLIELGEGRDGAAWLEEYLQGEDLGDLITEQWSWPSTKAMGLDVARGLSALHEVKVVHRDLSANNIRRLASGSHVVMDPGYARHADRSELTVGGQPGTAGFLSPEHIQGYSGAPTPASDVFCVGILMFLALTRALPVPYTGDAGDYVARLARVEIESITQYRTDLPADAREIVSRCLHPQPARRYRNGGHLARALEAASE